MSIAQRFVAGEGDLHPAHNEPTTTPTDSDALAAFRSDPVNLPWVIFRAAFRAAHVEQIPQRARAALAALARTVDSDRPYAAIFARRELLTGRSMQSMRTFYRSLDDLEAAGLIERRPQSRYVEAGLFGRSYLHLTERAAVILGFVTTPAVDGSLTVGVAVPAASPAPSAQAAEASARPFTGPSATVADGVIYKDLLPKSFQKRQPGQPPEDLQRLRTLGFHDFLIFRLMREARERGKRLSDVVDATWQHLKQADAPICYLRSLIASTVDFGFQVQRRQEALDTARRKQAEALEVQQTVRRVAGRVFVRDDGKQRYAVSGDGTSLTVQHVDESVPRVSAGEWQSSFVAALQSGRIHEGTPERVQAFKDAFAQGGRAHRTSGVPSHAPDVDAALATSPRALTPGGRDSLAALKKMLGVRPHQAGVVDAEGRVALGIA